jgi:hypothetical protein
VVEIPFADGRYFSPLEQEAGREVAIIGYTIADACFRPQPDRKNLQGEGT